MMDLKEKVDENNITKSYEEFERLVRSEYPNPLYIYDEEEEYAQRFIKENPDSRILGNGIKGRAICKDVHSTCKYLYENAMAISNFCYGMFMLRWAMTDSPVDIVLKGEGGD